MNWDMSANAKMAQYLDLLLRHNEVCNLTATTDRQEASVRHIEDALALLSLCDFAGKSVIDVGSGGGLPGIPLRIAVPSLRLTLLDATQKKVDFLSQACQTLGLSDVRCLAARAEEIAQTSAYREQFDIAVARGVAYLPVLCELCLPFVKPGGVLLAMKQDDCADEAARAQNAARILGADAVEIVRYTLSSGQTHAVAHIQKTNRTPTGYPRRYTKIKANPL